jgi:hypothetical protein
MIIPYSWFIKPFVSCLKPLAIACERPNIIITVMNAVQLKVIKAESAEFLKGISRMR